MMNSGTQAPALTVPVSAFIFLACSCTATDIRLEPDIAWERLRPLDNHPELDSGDILNRPCVPGETVVVRNALGTDSASGLALGKGQFVVCIGNSNDGELTVADGPGNTWSLRRDEVNATRGFPSNWIAHDRDYLVWAYSRDTLIFRESLRNTYEGNFFYLLLDTEPDGSIARGMLIDSGTGFADLKPYVDPVIQGKPLIVVSTHSHWDHFGGHRHFMGMDNVELIGYQPRPDYNPYPEAPEYDLEGLELFFGIGNWPSEPVTYALGNRSVEILPVPGHTPDSIALYDHREQLLFTGDTIYPGLLFIESWPGLCGESGETARVHPTASGKVAVGGACGDVDKTFVQRSARVFPFRDQYPLAGTLAQHAGVICFRCTSDRQRCTAERGTGHTTLRCPHNRPAIPLVAPRGRAVSRDSILLSRQRATAGRSIGRPPSFARPTARAMMKAAPRQTPYRGADIEPFACEAYAPNAGSRGSTFSSIDTVPTTAT